MGLNEALLVVVSVLQGRRFPKRPRHKIIVETKFDGETLVTDPIDHVESPSFTTELAWELSKKSLHQHRLQRTPIKIQCYALDTLSSQKEPVGYVILDLRTAQLKPSRAQWHSLLSTKYQRLKPELKLMLSLEDDTQQAQPAASHQEQTQQGYDGKLSKPSSTTKLGSEEIHFMLNENQGYYEIGPQQDDNQIFVLSVTIGLASNLAKLIPSTFPLSDPSLGDGFYFYYSLLSNDVTNEVFHDLLQPNFPAERASVRINSTLDQLKAFFNQHPGLEIHLCSGDQSLGKAVVSFQGLLSEQETLSMPAVIEGMFPLVPSGSSHQLSGAAQDTEPGVGVSLSLRLEQQDIIGNAPSASSPVVAREGRGMYRQDMSQADNIPFGSKSPPKQLLEPVSPPREKPRESRKGPETERGGEFLPGTPPRPFSSTPHSGQERHATTSGMNARSHKVKSCVTAFHVTCGFKHGLEMRTVLDDTAADGVRHISYCTKHSHRGKSPSKKTKEESNGTKTSPEDAENLRQKRLKQMEEEFYKFVSATDIAKDLNLPKELAIRIHKYWTLKRKVQDDVPLLPPTLKQQEKLSGKQGAADSSRNLQAQLERIVKLRCNLEKLRNLCYMVTKREKMRRELYRAREEVFWKEYEVMTDETCDLDEKAVQWVLALCKDNFSGDGSMPSAGDGCDDILADSLSLRISSTVESSSTTSSSGDCSSTEQDAREGRDPGNQMDRGGAPEGCSSDGEEGLELSPARRTRGNSQAVNQTSSSDQPPDTVAGCSKDSESAENSDSDVISRKRTRVKSQSSCEASVMTPKRALRHTITEIGEVARDPINLEDSSSGKTRRRRTRHLSFPNVSTKTKEESDKEGALTSEEDFQNSDAISRETRSRTPRTAKKRDAGETGSEAEKPEVDEKESRKENDPLRRENMVEHQRTGNKATKVAGKRKRSKSATAIDDNTNVKQPRITDFLRRKSPNRREKTSSKSPRLRGSKKIGDSNESDQVRTETSVENKSATSPRSFHNGRETTSSNLCPHCKLQHDKLSKCDWPCKDGNHTAECEDNWNHRELRLRSFQSPKSRARCSHAVTPKPHCCSSLMSKFCHATVT